MNEFFGGSIVGKPFEPFSAPHISALVVIVLLNILLAVWLSRAGNTRGARIFSFTLAGLLILNEAFITGWNIWTGSWSPDYALPLHLCDAASFLAAFMLLMKSRFLLDIVYYWGLGGSLQAILTPDLYYPFPHIMFFCFFLGHGAILTSIVCMVFGWKHSPSSRSILRTFVFTNAYMLILVPVNMATGGNYMFLCSKPENPSMLDFLGPWPWYILSLEAVGILVCLICYAPFGLKGLRRAPSGLPAFLRGLKRSPFKRRDGGRSFPG